MQQFVIALDIGGTLVKAGFRLDLFPSQHQLKKVVHDEILILRDQKNPKKTQTQFLLKIFDSFPSFLEFFTNDILDKFSKILIEATGGGSFKCEPQFKKLTQAHPHVSYSRSLNQFQVCGETLKLLASDLHSHSIKIRDESQEIYKKWDKKGDLTLKKSEKAQIFPLIIVNIGSGISFLKFIRNQAQKSHLQVTFQRVGGTSLGAGYLMGLEKLIQPSFNFENFQNIKEDSLQMEIIKAYCEHLVQISLMLAETANIKKLFFSGNFTRSSLLKNMLAEEFQRKNEFKDQQKKVHLYFSVVSGFMGVIGILYKYWSSDE